MSKRIIALALCAGMLLLSGCASERAAGTSGGTTNNNGQEPTSPSASGQVAADTRTSFEKLFDDGPLLVQNADELWGYIDITGEYVIEPQFMSAYEFQDNGLAAAMDSVTGLWGFINTSGEYVIKPAFTEVSPNGFSENGLASVVDANSGYSGCINESGAYVIEPQYSGRIGDFSGGWAVASNQGAPGYLNSSGEFHSITGAKEVYGFDNGRAFIKLSSSGKYKLLDDSLEFVTDTEYDYVSVDWDSDDTSVNSGIVKWYDGICTVLFKRSTQEGGVRNYAYAINTDGEVILPKDGLELSYIGNFVGGYAFATDADTNNFGIIDASGNWVFPPQYESGGASISSFGFFGLADIGSDNIRYYNTQGEVILECTTPNARFVGAYRDIIKVQFSNVNSYESSDQYSYVNHDGDFITELTFEQANTFSSDSSYAKVMLDGRWGIIDAEGNWLLEPQFLSIGR